MPKCKNDRCSADALAPARFCSGACFLKWRSAKMRASKRRLTRREHDRRRQSRTLANAEQARARTIELHGRLPDRDWKDDLLHHSPDELAREYGVSVRFMRRFLREQCGIDITAISRERSRQKYVQGGRRAWKKNAPTRPLDDETKGDETQYVPDSWSEVVDVDSIDFGSGRAVHGK